MCQSHIIKYCFTFYCICLCYNWSYYRSSKIFVASNILQLTIVTLLLDAVDYPCFEKKMSADEEI